MRDTSSCNNCEGPVNGIRCHMLGSPCFGYFCGYPGTGMEENNMMMKENIKKAGTAKANKENKFMNSLENFNNDEFVLTENGAIAYATTGKKLLDLNFSVTSMRNASDEEIVRKFDDAYAENPILAIKWLFYASDIREGLGERRLFRVCFRHLAICCPGIAVKLLSLIQEYSRWDNMFIVSEISDVCDVMYTIIDDTLSKDYESMKNGNPVSLLAKWMPSINTSSDKTKALAKKFALNMSLSHRDYRKILAELRRYIDVTEVKMSDRRWNEIDYSKVPSKANIIYKDAFMRHDTERRQNYLDAVAAGEEKINSSVAFPHEIVAKYRSGYRYSNIEDETLEAMWRSLPDYVDGASNTLVIRDGSGSMCSSIGSTSVMAIDVATALTIYFAERSSGAFKDKFVTFSESPEIVDLSGKNTLAEKLKYCETFDDYTNTDIEKTMQLILNAAIAGNCSQEDLPSNILIVSDMEFDAGVYVEGNIFDTYKKKFELAGYKMPRLVFWNVMSRTNNIPIKENDLGVALVSGFSANVCKMVLSNKLDPWEALMDILNSERYNAVQEAIE